MKISAVLIFLKNHRKRLAIVFLRIILVILSIEISLRILEFGYNYYHINLKSLCKDVDSSAYRIMCIGESTVNGIGATSTEYAFPHQLEMLLKKQFPEQKIQVFRLGTIGFLASEIVLGIDKELSYYKPHMVILIVGENVKWSNGPLRFKKENYLTAIRCHVRQCKTFKLFGLLNASLKKELWIKSRNYESYTYYAGKTIKRNKKAINYMIHAIKKYNAKIIMCNYFIGWFNDYIPKIAIKNSVIFCDNEKIYLEYKKIGRENEIISEDNWHPNNKGYYLMAENIFDTIKKKNLIVNMKK